MMNAFINSLKIHASLAQTQYVFVRWGKVSSYNPTNYTVKVIIQPHLEEDEETPESGWLPLLSPWVGNQWGMFSPPEIGSMCAVIFELGNAESGIALSAGYNAEYAPLPVKGGECWLYHKSGSFLKFTNDGKLLLNGNLEIDMSSPTININSTQAVNITAPQVNIGSTGQSLENLVKFFELASYLDGHTHNDPQGGVTGPPTSPLPQTAATTVIRGG